MSRKLVTYNRAVLDALRAINPDCADRLNSQGVSLGLWDNIAYWHIRGVAPNDAAQRLVADMANR